MPIVKKQATVPTRPGGASRKATKPRKKARSSKKAKNSKPEEENNRPADTESDDQEPEAADARKGEDTETDKSEPEVTVVNETKKTEESDDYDFLSLDFYAQFSSASKPKNQDPFAELLQPVEVYNRRTKTTIKEMCLAPPPRYALPEKTPEKKFFDAAVAVLLNGRQISVSMNKLSFTKEQLNTMSVEDRVKSILSPEEFEKFTSGTPAASQPNHAAEKDPDPPEEGSQHKSLSAIDSSEEDSQHDVDEEYISIVHNDIMEMFESAVEKFAYRAAAAAEQEVPAEAGKEAAAEAEQESAFEAEQQEVTEADNEAAFEAGNEAEQEAGNEAAAEAGKEAAAEAGKEAVEACDNAGVDPVSEDEAEMETGDNLDNNEEPEGKKNGFTFGKLVLTDSDNLDAPKNNIQTGSEPMETDLQEMIDKMDFDIDTSVSGNAPEPPPYPNSPAQATVAQVTDKVWTLQAKNFPQGLTLDCSREPCNPIKVIQDVCPYLKIHDIAQGRAQTFDSVQKLNQVFNLEYGLTNDNEINHKTMTKFWKGERISNAMDVIVFPCMRFYKNPMKGMNTHFSSILIHIFLLQEDGSILEGRRNKFCVRSGLSDFPSMVFAFVYDKKQEAFYACYPQGEQELNLVKHVKKMRILHPWGVYPLFDKRKCRSGWTYAVSKSAENLTSS